LPMGIWNTVIIQPLTYLIKFLYDFCGSYGGAIILFTVVTKLILLPLAFKQQKSMVLTQRIQPQLKALQEKYKNDQQKLSEETLKLYKENNISMFSGCLPLLIQLPIIYALYYVIRGAGDIISPENHMFLGIFNLSQTPSLSVFTDMANFWTNPLTPLLLVPILSVVTSYLQSVFASGMPKKEEGKKEQDPAASTMGMMKYMMPLFSGYITFIVPAGVGLYWITSSLFQVFQSVLITKYYNKKLGQGALEQKGVVVQNERKKANRSNRKKHR
jgi:YidC/Oxa1 family membrane protein insertase